MAWLSGVILSRGMSAVSEMISATLSKVLDDIRLVSKSAQGAGARRRPGEQARFPSGRS
jgi:hypothetical protein